MKTKHVLIVLVLLAGSSVHVHSLSNVFSDAATGCTYTLAAAYGEVGDFDSAIRFQKQAIRQAQKEAAAIKDPERRRSGYEKEITLYQTRLAGYERHQPWRSSPKLEGPIVD